MPTERGAKVCRELVGENHRKRKNSTVAPSGPHSRDDAEYDQVRAILSGNDDGLQWRPFLCRVKSKESEESKEVLEGVSIKS